MDLLEKPNKRSSVEFSSLLRNFHDAVLKKQKQKIYLMRPLFRVFEKLLGNLVWIQIHQVALGDKDENQYNMHVSKDYKK